MNSNLRNELIDRALAMRARAYAPYSNYHVGASLASADGTIFDGCNVENAVYPLCLCAERTATFTMVAAGHRQIAAIAVATENGGSPCGSCRQVLVEFAADIPVYLVDAQRNVTETTLHTLLPMHFDASYLPK